ncbi:putative Flp pilus-assembly TadE/G-like protein [Streptomyces sp. 2333.5]|uniref:pilus assembly protein TadG-related protein n=1 Tax=unclassified Streptomyces TaxID=2593676 RepID=UPI00089A56DE|nr:MULTISPECIES: pilus assembly protein TadG-related protein [unclassified Streptomyces]PJJ04123.1 putative Flp pilus-assembly TadE/G-like protein [Streptomyces sp. 2333.5]SEE43156.1 Putative Flp pilus-assembly TadE/G-like [Streptomyces sp. 2314.4]SEE68575.1 Putative Flp pilus-assembly TadE/G-like [Streptomyces sp. 2112.2]
MTAPLTGPTRRGRRDAGQAFPVYIVVVGGLLFLALAFFAVGQAAATRNGAQTAADAAALAAGQKYRDLLTKSLLDGLRDGSYVTDRAAWEDLLNGRGAPSDAACESADWFAGRNGAEVSGAGCVPDSWPTSFAVTVTTRKTVGNSVIPMTRGTHAQSEATSVVGPRCTLAAPADDGGGTAGTGDEGGTDGKGKGGKDDTGHAPVELRCDGKRWALDPDHLQDLPEASDLFSVRLAH